MSDYNLSTKAYQEAANGVHVVASDLRDEYWFKLGFYSRQKMHNADMKKYQEYYEKIESERIELSLSVDVLKSALELLINHTSEVLNGDRFKEDLNIANNAAIQALNKIK